jgi:hypothetical protein
MKVGMIFESGPQGAETQVCEFLARRIQPGIVIVPVTHRNKPEMIADCGKDVVQLLKERCQRILIIWDLFPPWRKRGEQPCRKEDREAILNSLELAGVRNAPVFLLCIREELEAWLLADGRALSTVLSTEAHPVRVQSERHPDHVTDPKGRLKRIFKQSRRGRYNDLVHAIKIIHELPDLTYLRRSESFQRFEEKLLL